MFLDFGEAIVSGKVTPDNFVIDKKENRIISKDIKKQKTKLSQADGALKWKEIQNGDKQSLSDEDILKLAGLIKEIEKFYGFPVDVEWGIENSKIYILQCRPITTVKQSEVNELINKIRKKGNWKFYVARKFNWFVENTEIYASLEQTQKDLLGFEIKTQNYLCLNGDEYSVDSDFEELCHKLDSYFNKDINFFEKFAEIEFEIVEEIKDYLEKLKSKNLSNLKFNELYEEMKKFRFEYIRSFVPGMTRPEDYLMVTLEKELKDMDLKEDNIQNIFSKVSTCPNYAPLSYSEEPLDLLKIALEMKKGKEIDSLIDEHIEKYAWIKAPVEFEDTSFTKNDYIDRLENIKNINIEEKIQNILKIRKNNDIEYEEVLKQYKFTEKAKKLIKAIRDFIFLRTYTTEYSDHLFYMARHTIFSEISKRCNIPVDDLIMLDDKEILSILENEGIIKDEIIDIMKQRKKGFAMIWLDGNVKTIFGDDSLELQTEIANSYKVSDERESGKNVISGTVANKGKVRGTARILLSYEDIYKVQKGDIIIATMTTPDYISAMEKASGFVTDEGGVTCHAAILSREFDVPCIVGTINATKEIKDGQLIELDAYNGKVYAVEE